MVSPPGWYPAGCGLSSTRVIPIPETQLVPGSFRESGVMESSPGKVGLRLRSVLSSWHLELVAFAFLQTGNIRPQEDFLNLLENYLTSFGLEASLPMSSRGIILGKSLSNLLEESFFHEV